APSRSAPMASPTAAGWRTASPTTPGDRRQCRSASSSAVSGLFELDQRTAEILRVQEQNRLAVGARTRLAVAENPRARGPQPVARGADVADLVTDVMHPAGRVAGEEIGDRRVRTERFEQLDLGVGQLDKDDGDAVLRQRLRRRNRGAESVAVARRRSGEIGHRDGDMVEPADHGSLVTWMSMTGRLP